MARASGPGRTRRNQRASAFICVLLEPYEGHSRWGGFVLGFLVGDFTHALMNLTCKGGRMSGTTAPFIRLNRPTGE